MGSRQASHLLAAQAQCLADQGVVECRICKRHEGLDGAIQLWRNGVLVFALCDGCAQANHVLMTPTDEGVAIRAKRVRPYVITGGGS